MTSVMTSVITSLSALTSIALLLLIASSSAQQQVQCMSDIDSCSCNLADGRKIDLHPLDGGATPRFTNIIDSTNGDMWTYNPCSDFTVDTCFGAAVCQGRQGGSYVAGYQFTASFETDPRDGLRIKYIADADAYRTSYVQLLCNPNDDGTMTTIGEIGVAEYYLTVSSKYACPTGGPGPGPSVTYPPIGPTEPSSGRGGGGGLTPGSIMLIVLIVGLSVYITSGVLVQKFARQKEGKELIPNVAFWVLLPGLVKDGSVFVFEKLRGLCGKKAGYDEV